MGCGVTWGSPSPRKPKSEDLGYLEAEANTGVPRLRAPRSARNDGEKAKANTGVLRLAALAQDDGGVGDDSQDLCNWGQRMGAIARRMGRAACGVVRSRGRAVERGVRSAVSHGI